MLVLTRRSGEAIQIGDDVEITVLSVRGDQVRLGIRAPRLVPVLRSELLQQVSSENQAAAEAARLLARPPASRKSDLLKPPRPAADIATDGARKRRSTLPAERRPCTAHTRC
jgi:carbon storage regulator